MTTLVVASASLASADNGVSVSGSINGVPLSQGTESHPIKLDPKEPVDLTVNVRNDSNNNITVRTIRLEGVVAGLNFYRFDTAVVVNVDAHSSETRKLSLDLGGLDGQATGLIPSRLIVLDAGRHSLASQSFVVDVHGSLFSVYGLFGLAILVVTALSLVGALVALARGRLHPNRWRRGLRFLVPGIGVGLLLVFSLSAFRVLAPQPSRWLPTVVISAIVFFVLGYLTPNPTTADDDEDDDEFAVAPQAVTVEPVSDVAQPAPPPPAAVAEAEPETVTASTGNDAAPVVPEWPQPATESATEPELEPETPPHADESTVTPAPPTVGPVPGHTSAPATIAPPSAEPPPATDDPA
jgi:hypothetical protein